MRLSDLLEDQKDHVHHAILEKHGYVLNPKGGYRNRFYHVYERKTSGVAGRVTHGTSAVPDSTGAYSKMRSTSYRNASVTHSVEVDKDDPTRENWVYRRSDKPNKGYAGSTYQELDKYLTKLHKNDKSEAA